MNDYCEKQTAGSLLNVSLIEDQDQEDRKSDQSSCPSLKIIVWANQVYKRVSIFWTL